MFGKEDLKNKIQKTDDWVECPVRDCKTKVERQRRVFRKNPEFKCQEHGIYISPTTFEYETEKENLLWNDESDLHLLSNIKDTKRESRMSRDNSEDALSWNVFRYLEKEGLLKGFLSFILQREFNEPAIIYWGYSQKEKGLWSVLKAAREEFELIPSKGTEPDLMIIDDDALIVIEAKLTAGNNTKPSNLAVEEKYTSARQGWWGEVFKSNFQKVAVEDRKYELARMWLLGSWMAEAENKDDFYLVNLVRQEDAQDIEAQFKTHIREDASRKFDRITWEEIYSYLKNASVDTGVIDKYFENKTVGYDHHGRLLTAFDIGTGLRF